MSSINKLLLLKIVVACFFVFFGTISLAHGQIRQIKHTLKKFYQNNDSLRTGSLLPVPDLGSSPEKGIDIGGMLVHSFYANPKDYKNYASNYMAGFTISTLKVYRIGGRWNIWTSNNQHHFLGESWYYYQPFYYYGVGAKTLAQNQDLVTKRWFKFNFEAEKKLGPNYYLGLNLSYENNSFASSEEGYFKTDGYTAGKNGGNVLFLGLNQVFDSRNLSTYPQEGTMLKITYSYAPNLLPNNAFEGTFSAFDFRNFYSLNKQTVLAFNYVYQNIQGENVPFFLMPTLGKDRLFRGYYDGRFRSNNLALFQSELRYRPHQRIGIVGILGIGTVYEDTIVNSVSFKPNFGLGLRYFFDLEKKLSFRFDYVLGEKLANEARQKGMYISIGEAF